MMIETYTKRADAICRSNQTYQQKKADARQLAIEVQNDLAAQAISYGELAEIQDSLYTLAKQTGLIKEFQTNGIL